MIISEGYMLAGKAVSYEEYKDGKTDAIRADE